MNATLILIDSDAELLHARDAIHLAALEFVRAQKQDVQLASYDDRLLAAARLLGIAEWSARR